MSLNSAPTPATDTGLLRSGEPAPFTILDRGPAWPVLLVCDHATARIPAALGTLGLPHAALADHIALDIGAAAVTRFLSETLRLQLAPVGVQVIELVPPAVRTALMPGHETSDAAMPLDAFVDEVMDLIKADPYAREILVDRVKFLRYAEVRGDYDQVVATLNAADPHARRPARQTR